MDRVPAPAPLGNPQTRDVVNAFFEETMGVTNAVKDIRDPRTGEMVPGWSWRIEQLARNVPWLNFVLTATVPTKHQRPNDTALATAGFIAGPRPVQFDVQAVQLNQKWEERDQLQAEVDELKQTVPGHRRGDEWGGKVGRLNARIADIDRDIYKLGKAMGHEDPAGRPPRKGRKRTARYFGAAPAPQAPVEQAAVLRREPVTSVRSPAQDEG